MPTKEAGDVTATILVAPNLNEPLTPVYPTVPVTTAVSPAPFIDPSFNITVDNTCQGRQVIQIERALYELHRLSTDAIDILLKSSDSDLNKMYWGDHKKADLSTPVGVFHQLLEGSKTGVTIRCDEEEDKCKPEKVILAGGYVDKDRGTVHLCKSDFESKTQRRYIEDICQDDWTLNDNQPTLFWSAALLKLFLQLPQITANNQLHLATWAYPNFLNVARLDPVASAHNIDTYLYFMLDNFAQQHIEGGCRGSEKSSLVNGKTPTSTN